MKTTQKPAIDIEKIFPELALYRRKTIRLNPVRKDSLGSDETKFSGEFIWPHDEEWPVCSDMIYKSESGDKCIHNENYVGVLQVYKKQIPELELPGGKDVLQVLWCPEDHVEHYYAPKCKAFWRNSAEIVNRRKDFPKPAEPKEEYLIKTCTVNPEEVIEYPSILELYELDPQLADRIACWEEESEEPVYQYHLSVADGSKLGGYVHWIQDFEVPVCECGRDMEHLLTISDSEFDSGSYKRWCPEELAENIWELPYEERMIVQNPLNVRLGDMGKLFVFTCKHCEGWPIKTVFQCS